MTITTRPSRFNTGATDMAKVVCVLDDDAIDGYPTRYARTELPKIDRYPGGQTLPSPKSIDFEPLRKIR
jgi:hypothetical protein